MDVALGVLVVLLVVAVAVMVMQTASIRSLRRQLDDAFSGVRARTKNAVAQSRIIHVAKISEQFAPLLPGFPYNLKDFQWVGGTIDAIVWNGLEDGGDVDIIFLDVKTGRAKISPRQRRIRDAVEAGRLHFKVFPFRPLEVTAAVEATAAISDVAFAEDVTDEELGGAWVPEEGLDEETIAQTLTVA